MNLCSAKVASGAPCQAWAIHDTDPPLCPAHSGLLGAPRGNTNALKHGYYQKKLSPEEMQSQFDEADNVALKQEAILIRVVLRRLSQYLLNNEVPVDKIASIAPLLPPVFTQAKPGLALAPPPSPPTPKESTLIPV